MVDRWPATTNRARYSALIVIGDKYATKYKKYRTHFVVGSPITNSIFFDYKLIFGLASKSDDYEGVLQQLDDAIFSQDKSLLSDAMSELTNVMEKMTGHNDDVSEHQQS